MGKQYSEFLILTVSIFLILLSLPQATAKALHEGTAVFEIESDNVFVSEPSSGGIDHLKATKIYYHPSLPFAWDNSVGLVLEKDINNKWDLSRLLYQLSKTIYETKVELNTLAVGAGAECYLDILGSGHSEIELHGILGFDTYHFRGEMDIAPRQMLAGGESPSLGYLGYSNYRLNAQWGMGLRVLGEHTLAEEYVLLGPDLSWNYTDGITGFLYLGKGIDKRSSSWDQVMLRLGYAL